jgi:hypothetical protein
MRRAAACASLVIALAGASSPATNASQGDRASARTFLADATAYVRSSIAHRRQLKAAVRRFIEHLESSCPGSLASAPPPLVEHVQGKPPWPGRRGWTTSQRDTSRTFLTMAVGELQVAAYAPIRAPALAFANELTHLHWTSRRMASTLADFGQSTVATLALSAPDLCVDARASAAIGFAAAPAEATQFVHAFREATHADKEGSLIELANMMRPVLARSDLYALARFRRLWSRAEPPLQISGATLSRLMRAVFVGS